jgi:hypothetical protein
MPIRTAADPSFSNISRQANKLIEQMQKAYFTRLCRPRRRR